jgi:hypothetical protein
MRIFPPAATVLHDQKELESDDLVYQEGHGQAALWHLKQSLNKQ